MFWWKSCAKTQQTCNEESKQFHFFNRKTFVEHVEIGFWKKNSTKFQRDACSVVQLFQRKSYISHTVVYVLQFSPFFWLQFFLQNAKYKCTYESNKQSLQGQKTYWVNLNIYERNFDINKYRILYLKSAVRNYFDTSRYMSNSIYRNQYTYFFNFRFWKLL